MTGALLEPKFLLMKRGLYYRPDSQGYTGIKDHAGRYFESDAYEGVTAIHEDDAEEFSPACFNDLREDHLRKQRDEADRRAGAAEREMAELKDSASKRAAWLAKAKQDAGYSHMTSFDRVWADALPLLLDARNNKQPPAMDGMPILDNGLNTLIGGDCGVLDLVRKHDGGRHGLIMNLVRLQEWLDLYVSRAKAPADPREPWDWLTSQTALELKYYAPVYGDDDDLSEGWRVYRWSGTINDRERDLVGAGLSPLLAIESARAQMEARHV